MIPTQPTPNETRTSAVSHPARQWVVGQDEARTIGRLLKSAVVPRPIAWVSTRSADGILNLAPHSYFMILADAPPVLGFVSSGIKDTLRNIRETGTFVINIPDQELADAMNLTSAAFPADEDEFRWAGVTPEPSDSVDVPRVAEAPVAFDLRFREERDFGSADHPSILVVGDVLRIRVHERVLGGEPDQQHVLPEALRAIARMGGPATYSRTTDRFDLDRPAWDDLRVRNGLPEDT